jgi:DNA-binding NtrC family response regulator
MSSVDAPAPAEDAGVFEIVTKPLQAAVINRLAARLLQQRELLDELRSLRGALQQREGHHGLIGRSPVIGQLRESVERLAEDDRSVWISGEVGSGRSHAARTIHKLSGRADGPLVTFNGAAWGQTGLEIDDAQALVAEAKAGSIIFEEPADLPLESQQRLLRVLESAKSAAGPRAISVSRIEPKRLVADGRMLEPLGRLLTASQLSIPPLRERREDIALLARHFLVGIAQLNGLAPLSLNAESVALLDRQRWPGNVSQLRDAIEQAAILATDGTIGPQHFADEINDASASVSPSSGKRVDASRPFREAKREVVEAFERAYLRDLMRRHVGNVTVAAQRSGMLRSALQRLLRKYTLRSMDFRGSQEAGVERSLTS